jgi:hypothetical protein
MKKEQIPQLAIEVLSDVLNSPGKVLYSSHETLKPGNIYFLGFNPGGREGPELEKSIKGMLSSTNNSYLDESWNNGNGAWDEGKAPLQKRVTWLFKSLNLNPRDVCASNLIFLQSRKADDISFSLAEKCWPVHEAIINIVKPKIIITFGNSQTSPYGYLLSLLGGKEESLPSGHGAWRIKGFNTNINNHPVYIVGLPHLSRYSPIGKTGVIEWLKERLT